MNLRLAAAMLILMPVCASGFASPIGALTGPFAVQVLAQQRQLAANDNAARPKADTADTNYQPERGPKRGASEADAKRRAQAPVSDDLVIRSRGSVDPLPNSERKPSSN